MKILTNKNILLAVTGSVAIYKSLELVRLYIKQGANVKVIMTKSAQKFITPLMFETISQNTVLTDENEDWSTQSINNHIAVGKWADIFVIAPATVNTINALSNGLGSNILLQTALAYPRMKLLVPAGNTNMIKNPMTQASFKMLTLCNYRQISTTTKELACKDVGDGAMADVENIFHATAQELLKENYWINRKVVLTGGGTIEKIDDVRYISNFSSGKMANSLATALYYKGADVCLIATNSQHNLAEGIHIISVQNTQDMLEFAQQSIKISRKGKLTKDTLMDNSRPELIQKKPYFFSVAAVSDYIPKFPQQGKLKKDSLGDEWNLQLVQNIDILNTIEKREIYTVGFKAEMSQNDAKNNAQNMLKNKNLDAVCLNIINAENNFGSNTNKIELLTKQNNSTSTFQGQKLNVSLELLKSLQESFVE